LRAFPLLFFLHFFCAGTPPTPPYTLPPRAQGLCVVFLRYLRYTLSQYVILRATPLLRICQSAAS
jgi:hypothetical protein